MSKNIPLTSFNLRVLKPADSAELLALDAAGEIRIALYLLFTAGQASLT